MPRPKKVHLIRLRNLEKARKARWYGPRVAEAEPLEPVQDVPQSTSVEATVQIDPPGIIEEPERVEAASEHLPAGAPSSVGQLPSDEKDTLLYSIYLSLGGYDPAKPYPNALIPVETARDALEKLEAMFELAAGPGIGSEIAKLNPSSRRNTEAMRACLRVYCEPGHKRTLIAASIAAATAVNRSESYARNIRRFVRAFIQTGALPKTRYGARNSAPDVEDRDHE
ncbi:hypothetical protein FRC08_014494 [Ceratobasidium sp. 394]|nr:hypothetical protein FRC08_014494 [Ceratobasidium sp. 394]